MNASERQKLNPSTTSSSSDNDDQQQQQQQAAAYAKSALLLVWSFLSSTWSGALGVCGMGSSEGGRTAAEVSMADRTRRWRLPEFAGLVAAMVVINLVLACFSENEQFVPENNKEGVNGYPVRLGGEWCSAHALSMCHIQPESPCCREMAAGEEPFETVDTLHLWYVYFGVPAAFIAVRQVLIKVGYYRGAASLADVILGMFFCLGFSVTLTDAVKIMVGRPRPNYAALRALVEYGGSRMESYRGMSIRSFPSGHSSMAMAGTLYVTLVAWGDLSRFTVDHKGWRRSLLAYLSIVPAFLAIGVGVSRIRDFWHFQDDVVTGWIIGAGSAALAVRWVTFSEAFWRGGGGGGGVDDRFGVDLHGGSIQGLRDNGAMQLMMDSTHGMGDLDHGNSNEERAAISGDTLA